jgi:hypothetical protein
MYKYVQICTNRDKKTKLDNNLKKSQTFFFIIPKYKKSRFQQNPSSVILWYSPRVFSFF